MGEEVGVAKCHDRAPPVPAAARAGADQIPDGKSTFRLRDLLSYGRRRDERREHLDAPPPERPERPFVVRRRLRVRFHRLSPRHPFWRDLDDGETCEGTFLGTAPTLVGRAVFTRRARGTDNGGVG